jgi:hypothetical protein
MTSARASRTAAGSRHWGRPKLKARRLAAAVTKSRCAFEYIYIYISYADGRKASDIFIASGYAA